ncbi:MAG: sialate O-acetylesterase [Lentisphaeria bacterium]|nr:sialate O-acetylesterase [Lentisphaeria bacterium]
MKIHTGLLPSCVMARNANDVSEQLVTGTCRTAGDITAVIYKSGAKKPLMKLDKCGTAAKGRFAATLKGIPCGGPYRIELSCGDEKTEAADILVGDVWLLGGQSNMQGSGFITGKRLNTEKNIHACYLDDKWAMAQEPIGRVELSRHQSHLQYQNPPIPSRARKNPDNRGAGFALPFALERYRQTGVPQGLIQCAHGGTSITMWDPKTRDMGYDSLYGNMILSARQNGGRVSGMLWYQGESDISSERAPIFEEATINFFRAVRKDLKAPSLPIIQVQIGREMHTSDVGEKGWTIVREAQRTMHKKLRNFLTVPAVDLTLDDTIHLDEDSYFVLGKRVADAMQTLLGEPGALPPPIEVDRITTTIDRNSGRQDFRVKFKNVVGSLQSNGCRPAGFYFGSTFEDIAFKTVLQGDTVILKTTKNSETLGYGCGQNPYCNITDEAGRSLPATGQLKVKMPFARGEYAKYVMLSEPFLGNEDMSKITYDMAKKAKFAPAGNEAPFNIFPDRVKYLKDTGIRFFKTRYQASKAINLSLALGYDGNVKVFVDGKPIYTDEKARNPILPAQFVIPQHWSKGTHEVVIAMAISRGCTWGISLALETTPALRNEIPIEIQ